MGFKKRRGGTNISAEVRASFHRAILSLANDGKPLHDVIRHALLNDPMPALAVLSRFVPQQMMVEATVSEEIDELSDSELDKEIVRLLNDSAPAIKAAANQLLEQQRERQAEQEPVLIEGEKELQIDD